MSNIPTTYLYDGLAGKSREVFVYPGRGGTWCQCPSCGVPGRIDDHTLTVDQFVRVTVDPSLVCGDCGWHGWIREGRATA